MGVSSITNARTPLRRLVVFTCVSPLQGGMAANLACALATVCLAIILATADVREYAFNKRQRRSRKSPDTKINRPYMLEPKSQRKRFIIKQFAG